MSRRVLAIWGAGRITLLELSDAVFIARGLEFDLWVIAERGLYLRNKMMGDRGFTSITFFDAGTREDLVPTLVQAVKSAADPPDGVILIVHKLLKREERALETGLYPTQIWTVKTGPDLVVRGHEYEWIHKIADHWNDELEK